MPIDHDELSLKQEISRLENELSIARARLTGVGTPHTLPQLSGPFALPIEDRGNDGSEETTDKQLLFSTSQNPSHTLLHLADTALPLGSFAFSSGLESYLAHHKPAHNAGPDILPKFLNLSLHSLATTTLPYLIAAYMTPGALQQLDDELDACTLCPVAKRASISQGRALLTVWERALKVETPPNAAKDALSAFCAALRAPSTNEVDDDVEFHGHFAPIYSVVSRAQNLTLHQTAYTFLLNHAKAVASAAVRAGVLGPYAAQGVLGGNWLRAMIEKAMETQWSRNPVEAGQGVPALDVWTGRHEKLYSRIFNS
ncbi:MAG: hypothetical protein Q9163_005888 [Psora crenata]